MIDDPEAPMTEAQASILRELCEATGQPFDPDASRQQAEVLIASLRTRLEHDLEPGAGDNPDMS
ncbi:MAG: DUF3072 domain-containing protein [Amaricoccus sp.]